MVGFRVGDKVTAKHHATKVAEIGVVVSTTDRDGIDILYSVVLDNCSHDDHKCYKNQSGFCFNYSLHHLSKVSGSIGSQSGLCNCEIPLLMSRGCQCGGK